MTNIKAADARNCQLIIVAIEKMFIACDEGKENEEVQEISRLTWGKTLQGLTRPKNGFHIL